MNATGRVLQVVDLVVNGIELAVRPLGIERLGFNYEHGHVGFFSDDNLQDPMIDGGCAKQSVVEIKPGDPFAIGANLSDRDLLSAFLDGGDFDRAGAIGEAVLLGLNQGIDPPRKSSRDPARSGLACTAGAVRSLPILPA